MMKIEWDEQKNQSNRQKHLLDFGDAEEVLNNLHFVYEDKRHDYGAARYIAIAIYAAVSLSSFIQCVMILIELSQ